MGKGLQKRKMQMVMKFRKMANFTNYQEKTKQQWEVILHPLIERYIKPQVGRDGGKETPSCTAQENIKWGNFSEKHFGNIWLNWVYIFPGVRNFSFKNKLQKKIRYKFSERHVTRRLIVILSTAVNQKQNSHPPLGKWVSKLW